MLKLIALTIGLINIINMNFKNPDPKTDTYKFDNSVNPANNFYEFINNKWTENTKIPDDKSAWGNFHILAEKNEMRLREILDSLKTQNNKANSIEDKLNNLYLSGLDTKSIDQRSFEPIKKYLEEIKLIINRDDLLTFASKTYTQGLGFLFSYSVYADSKNPQYNVVHFFQGGINLPDKEYYLSNDKQYEQIRALYKDYIIKLFKLIGTHEIQAEKNAQKILEIETKIAESHRSQVELRDPNLNYNAFTIDELKTSIPNINWDLILSNMAISTKKVIIAQPDYYKNLATTLTIIDINDWKIKLEFDILHATAEFLSNDFRETKFHYYDKIFSGIKEQPERWKKIVRLTNSLMGEAIGKLFVEKFFPKEAKDKMIDLIKNLKQAYQERIKKLDWMDYNTKAKAIDKLHTMNYKIGYPDKFKNYDNLKIEKGKFFENVLSLYKYEYLEEIKKIDKKVDKSEWAMPPATVNAYYSPLTNEIVFPAGILQAPFFDFNASNAENYGAIGVIIGHEITHGFDDQGRKYDSTGKLNDWWSNNDLKKFTSKTAVFVKQYNDCVILDKHVNGELTLGENIADLGGLQISLDALRLSNDSTVYKEHNQLQTFFISYARMWRMKTRDEYMKLRLNIDPHSPEIFRVNIPLSNMEEFYKAFNVKKDNALYRPKDKIATLW
ncbi:MAG: M13 family metallopeptidase [Solitalea-like symbiont of Acarus siro]